MRALIIGLGRAMKFFEGLALKLSAVFLGAMVLLINVEIFSRFLFNSSTRIADEYGGYFYAWIVLLGGVHLLRSDRYLMMTSVLDMMSPRVQNFIYIIAAAVGLTLCAVCFKSAFELTYSSFKFHTESPQPSGTLLWYPQLAMPFGYALLCAAYLEEILRRSAGLPPRRAEDDVETYGVGDTG
jgi:TRAP-type C4-dicarboxylate transport system permease small subunit